MRVTRQRNKKTNNKKKPRDFVVCNQRGEILTHCKVTTNVDIGSDHRWVRMTLRMKERFARLITTFRQKPFNINTQKLKDMTLKFVINLSIKN